MENIYSRVEPLDPTVNVLCAFSAALGEGGSPNMRIVWNHRSYLFGEYPLP